jgi:hypothetical protein
MKELDIDEKVSKAISKSCGYYQDYLVKNIGYMNDQNYEDILKAKNDYLLCQRQVKQTLI